MTKIIVNHLGEGWEKKDRNIPRIAVCERPTCYPAFMPDGTIPPRGEYEAELVEQYKPLFQEDWVSLGKGLFAEAIKEGYYPIRQIWRIIEAKEEKRNRLADSYAELATFSQVPIVNEYYKSIKSMHHDSEITKGIEEFALWLQQQPFKKFTLLDETAQTTFATNSTVPSQQPPASDLTAKEILARHSIGKFITLGDPDGKFRLYENQDFVLQSACLEAMHEYADLKTAELQRQIEDLKKSQS